MPAISVGSVEVDIVPNATGIKEKLRAALVPSASEIGDEVGRIIGRQIATHIAPAVRDGINDGAKAARPAATRQGSDTGGAFARSLRAKLTEAFRSMPKLDVKLGDTGVDADLARLRAKLESLSGKTVGIDIDAATARAQAADIEERLRRIGAAHPNVAVRADTARAIASLQALRAQIDEVSADPLRIRIETDGQLGARLRAVVQQAEASLPNINIGADTTPAEVEIARLRAQLTALKDARIGIDIDAGTALARIKEIQTQLARLSARNPNVGVRVDTGAAAAQLAAFQTQVNRLDGRHVRLDLDAASAVSGMQLLVATAVAFGPAILPVLPVVAAGLGAIAAAGVAAGVGIGSVALVAVPALKQIGTVLTAQKAAQTAATTATNSGAQASQQAASKALQMAGAQQALATAERNGARQIAQAQQQVVQAKRAAADAIVQAAQRNQQAARQVQDAERSLADAQVAAKRAQDDLTDARRTAARELQDLNNQLTDSVLSQRDAEIALKEATLQRDAVLKSATATELDKQKANLQYDQAVQRLKEQTTETGRLKAETKAANKAGVEGSDTVKNAQDQVAQSQRTVADQTRAVADAQTEAARIQVETARQIADAQQKVGEATANVAVAQQSAADAVTSAQRQIESASMSAAGGVDQAAVAQAKYLAELAKLTPAARTTMGAYLDLRSAFGEWSKSLQPAVMPIFTRALIGMKNALPGLTPLVLAAADAIGGLQDRVSRGFKSPWWKEFKADLEGSVGPAITGLGISFGQVFKGMAGVIQAFLPHMDGISSRMQAITKRFASWGTSLKGSPQFEGFLAYVKTNGPPLAEFLGKLMTAFLDLAKALGPLSDITFAAFGPLLDGLSWLSTHAPGVIQLLWGLYLATKAIALGMVAFKAAMLIYEIAIAGATLVTGGWAAAIQATGIVPLIEAIVLAVAALVIGIIWAYKNVGWFRTAVDAAWTGIKAATLFLWNSVLKPAFDGIMWAIKGIGAVAMWLWTNAIGPAFRFIWEAAKILLTIMVVGAILPIIFAFKLLGKAGLALWQTAIQPAFHGIAVGAKWLYDHAIKPNIDLAIVVFRAFAKIGTWLWKNALSPIFRSIADGAKGLYTNGIKPAMESIVSVIKTAYRAGVKPVFDAFHTVLKGLGGWFEDAVGAIKTQWDKLRGIAKAPVKFVVDTVYNKGIVGVWNKVADAFGAPKLSKFNFASGGIMPGYTPGRDVHQFVSPTGGSLGLSGGEAIMRPEFTRAVGSGFVGAMNSIAKSRGAQGVKAALAPVFGGNPSTPTDRSLKYANGGIHQAFAGGGIFGWIGKGASAIAGAGSAAWNKIKEGASWLKDSLEGSARAGVKNVVDPLLAKFPGMDTGFGKLIRHIPTKIIDALFGYSKDADKKGAGGIGGPKIQAALKWAKTQNELPYQWGGNGNPSWDCSGLVSAAESVIRGQKPHRRWATGSFSGNMAPPGWVKNGASAFKIGITNAGVGHTAGTLGKTNIESRGGDGVIIGKGARAWNDKLFKTHYGFMPGTYDQGGMLPPGLNLAYNGTGRPEPVFTSQQANALTSAASRGGGEQTPVVVELHANEGTLGQFIDVRVLDHQQHLISVINAS